MMQAHLRLTVGVSFRTFNLVQQETIRSKTQRIMLGSLLGTVVSSFTYFPYPRRLIVYTPAMSINTVPCLELNPGKWIQRLPL